jgi:methylglyoxal/glyoxal reductase
MHLTVEDTHLRLNTGVLVPKIGFGTWKLEGGDEARGATKVALELGYRLIDTAAIYINEESIGEAIRSSDVPREDIFVTTKLWSSDLGYERAFSAYENSLSRLGLNYIDLYLIHWPAHKGRLDAWRAMEEMYREEKVKNIGVSNFTMRHLEELRRAAHLVPAVNQIELHPRIYKEQRDLLEYCHARGIVVEAYSPLGQGGLLNEPPLRRIGAVHDKTSAQVLLRWCVQHDTVPIPKTSRRERMKENFDIFDFELSREEMVAIDHMGKGKRMSPDPATME